MIFDIPQELYNMFGLLAGLVIMVNLIFYFIELKTRVD